VVIRSFAPEIHLPVNLQVMKTFLKIVRIGLLSSTILLSMKPTVASATVTPSSMVITEKVTAGITNRITLQFTTNLSSSTWQAIGVFSGSTNLSFTNLPTVFIRGICSNLTATATLAWQPSTGPTVVGYKLHYGVASRTYTNAVDVGQLTMATISNLVPSTTYYFAATAYDSSGTESPYSNEASSAFQPSFSLAIGSP